MAGIKRTPEDALFSRYVRARAGFHCEACGTHGTLEAAHIFGRRHAQIRCDEANCVALCHSCHRYYTENPADFTDWIRSNMGGQHIDALRERRNCTDKLTLEDRLENAAYLHDCLVEWGDEQADELYRKAVNWLQSSKKKASKKTSTKKRAIKNSGRKFEQGKYKQKLSGEVVPRETET